MNNTQDFWGIIIYPLMAESKQDQELSKKLPYMFHLSWNSAFYAALSGTSFVTKLLISQLEAPWVNEMEIH